MPAEAAEAIAPLHRALGVAHAFARDDQVAARERNRDRIRQLAGEHGGIHGIQLAHALGDPAGRGHRESPQRARRHLEVDRAGLTSNAHALFGKSARAIGIAVLEQGGVALANREERALGAVAMAVEQLMRAPQPALRHRLLPAERGVVPADPHRHPRRANRVLAIEIQPIRAFARVEHDIREVEPPRGRREAFERFGCRVSLQRLLEGPPRVAPFAACERRRTERDRPSTTVSCAARRPGRGARFHRTQAAGEGRNATTLMRIRGALDLA